MTAIETTGATSATTERSEIQFGLTRIPFQSRRSDKRETVALTIETGGRLVVPAPARTPIDKLKDVVRSKGMWIVSRVRAASDRPPPRSDREFVTGETVLYKGPQYRLKLMEQRSGDGHELRIWAGWCEVWIPAGPEDDARRREVRRPLVSLMKEHADIHLPRRLYDLYQALETQPPPILVRGQRRRWGSCDAAGVPRINWRIVQSPPALIHYVLVHELAHLRFASHGPEFWGLVERWMPEYEERGRRLRKLGEGFER